MELDPLTEGLSLPRPIENSYWVLPGSFLAGEYPREANAETSEKKLKRFLDAGFTHFIDVTRSEDRIPDYAGILGRVAGDRIEVVKHPIPEGTVPPSRDAMIEILDDIDLVVDNNGKLYLHCLGGTGRTGIVVGCWLARHGAVGRPALRSLRKLWDTCPMSWSRKTPDTREQEEYILNWNEHLDEEDLDLALKKS